MNLYTYKGVLYELLFINSKMKINDIWVYACVYMSTVDASVYTISTSEFNREFEKYVK